MEALWLSLLKKSAMAVSLNLQMMLSKQDFPHPFSFQKKTQNKTKQNKKTERKTEKEKGMKGTKTDKARDKCPISA